MQKNLGFDAAAYSRAAGFASEWRDTWWNQDYLELLAARFGLREAESVLDVGCGAGHWGQRLVSALSEGVSLVGVDHEAGFLDAARARATERGVDARYEAGAAESLPFGDGTFDVVTCQTVLIHVADARVALSEMIRVTRPGGRVIAVEPNNVVNALVGRVQEPELDLEELLRLLRFAMLCREGKRRTGQGDGAIGERLPGILVELGLEDVTVQSNDRCAMMAPPYAERAQAIQRDQLRAFAEGELTLWGDRERARALYLAGGGDASTFDELFDLDVAHQRRAIALMDEGRFSTAGTYSMVIAVGRKPA
ncbi:MAG: class I SAM-dependent methyltransferase [Sandaracinaceae bacterium]